MPLIHTPSSYYATLDPLANYFFPSNASSPSTVTVAAFGFSATPSKFLRKTTHPHIPSFVFSTTRNRSRAASTIRAKAGTDYYSTLNVTSNATLQEIKSAYRKLARKVCLYLFIYLSFGFCGLWDFYVFWHVYVVVFGLWGNWGKGGELICGVSGF